MIYTKEDVKRELERYFAKDAKDAKDDTVTKIKSDIEKVFAQSDILKACKIIKDSIVNRSNENGILNFKDKKFLPDWVKYLVYVVIYQYFEKNKEPQYTQSTLLKEMGLYADIFGKKNWCMYSPDMKIRQAKYENLELPFNHSEIESNDIFRAMIHHMVCYSTVLTDTFVDMFGKLGVIPATCANGYKSSQVWLGENDYKVLCVFILALEKKIKVCKILKEFQYEIKHSDDEVETVSRLIGLAVGLELNIKNMSKEQIHCNIVNGESWGFDIYKFAGCFIIQQFFASEYWMDSRLLKVEDKDKPSNSYFSSELVSRVTKQKIQEFLELRFVKNEKELQKFDSGRAIESLSDAYKAKRFFIVDVNIKRAIETFFSKDNTDLLYIDVPKFMREQDRFEFDTEWYSGMFSSLSRHKGDWIMSWKNYVEKTNIRKPNSMYINMWTKGMIHSMWNDYSLDDIPKKVTKNSMCGLYKEIKAVDDVRPLYVYSYRDDDRNHPNSIVFITTIDFADISDFDFQSKYKVDFLYDGRLKKMTYNEFYANALSYLDNDKKQAMNSEK